MDLLQTILANELENMKMLRDQSMGLLDFEVDPSHHVYTVHLNGIESLVCINNNQYQLENKHTFRIELLPAYPEVAPVVKFEPPGVIFHPNWWKNGVLCYGDKWSPNTTLNEFVIDIVKMMQYEIVNQGSPANNYAKLWYEANEGKISKIIKKIPFPPPIDDIQINELGESDDNDIQIEGLGESGDLKDLVNPRTMISRLRELPISWFKPSSGSEDGDIQIDGLDESKDDDIRIDGL